MEKREHTHFVLVRHAETAWNAERKLQGQTDIPLNEKGRGQAHALAEELSLEKFDGIYSSPLRRAHETAAIIAYAHSHLKVMLERDLQEGYYGAAEGMHVDAYHKEYAKQRLHYEKLPWQERLRATIVPDIETRHAIGKRVKGVLLRLSELHPNGRVLVVTHGGVIRAMLMYLGEEYSSIPFITNGFQIHLLAEEGRLNVHSSFPPSHA